MIVACHWSLASATGFVAGYVLRGNIRQSEIPGPDLLYVGRLFMLQLRQAFPHLVPNG